MSLCFHRNERGSFSVCGTFRVKGNAPIGTNVLLRLDFRIRISGGSADLGRESRGSGVPFGGEACLAGASPAKPEFTIYADDNARQPWDEATMYGVGFFAAAGKWCGGGRCDMLCQSNKRCCERLWWIAAFQLNACRDCRQFMAASAFFSEAS